MLTVTETEVIEVSSSSSSYSDTDGGEDEDGNQSRNTTKNDKAMARIKTYKRRRRYSDFELKSGEEKWRDDDDCCIIPSNPAVVDLTRKISEHDDLTVLAERGQVACRDYPHSRHLCAKYPFSKTSHTSCCLLCYCFVCDEAAPCKLWEGPGWHCDASDQEKKWKDMRRSRRPVQARKIMDFY